MEHNKTSAAISPTKRVRCIVKLEGIPSIGMFPFSCGWSTRQRNMTEADISMVIKAIDTGFVPVLHGDAVLDALQVCFSSIIEH
ncbi:hypothetical protein RND71_008625 [Anisodus tanguticus]|uniref:Isopentenyl phosphate kinase n=1 Tax=Anisodus tanguticus TaxID=243964 RepID=A0AAE1VQW5_9SOLA|nr:hypothetical protein RND71_008625 [Anisodus tanguticus]